MNGIGDRRRALAALSWLFSATALVAACGGGSSDSSPAPGAGTPAPAPGPAPGPAPAPSPPPAPGPAPAPAPAPIAQTPAGEPEGLPTFATIGAGGGTLASSDGHLTITVPAGALATDTAVGIQPIRATAPGALGSGYRLTPEGMNFALPVTLTLSYPAAEAAASTAESLRVATHDARGHWEVVDAARDASQGKLTVTATHFSDWSYVAGLQIAPASATVQVNKQLLLRVIDCGEGPDPSGGNSQRLLLECVDEEFPPLANNWSVNSIPGGNGAVGTIAGGSNASYRAPATLPPQNPVAASARVATPAGLTTLVSNIRVVDQMTVYEGTIFGRIVVSVNGQEQFFETSANLRFTYNPDLSIAGDKWYDGIGTAFVHGKPFGCGTGSGTAPVQGAALTLHTEGQLAGTYSLSGGAVATATLTCGDPPRELTGPFLVGGFGAGGSDICPSLQIGEDPGRLVGSWFCNVAEGSTARANWTLRAIE